jgi:NAD(P)-dependent dehydrogenase (short-subunit alcohol dehydrogenase family)
MKTCRDISGRRILLTGATSGFGRLLAEHLCEAGAELVAVGRSKQKLAELREALGGKSKIETLPMDLSQSGASGAMPARLDELGITSLDALINNAATQGPIGPVWTNDWEEWLTAVQVDLIAPVNLCRTLLSRLGQDGRRGKVINISGGGATGPRASFSAYAVAKTGLVRFTEILAAELRGRPIDVNAVAPGAMRTGMTDAILEAGEAMAGPDELAAAVRIADRSDAPVMAKAAALCAFLCSSASDGVSGKLIAAQWDPWEDFPLLREEFQDTDIYTLRRITPRDRGRLWGT